MTELQLWEIMMLAFGKAAKNNTDAFIEVLEQAGVHPMHECMCDVINFAGDKEVIADDTRCVMLLKITNAMPPKYTNRYWPFMFNTVDGHAKRAAFCKKQINQLKKEASQVSSPPTP